MATNEKDFEKMLATIEEMKAAKVSRAASVDADIETVKSEIEQHAAAMNEAAAFANVAAYTEAKAAKEAAETRLAMLETHRKTADQRGTISKEDTDALINSVHTIQDAALRKAYQDTIKGVDAAIKAIEDAERVLSAGNDVLIRFDTDVAPLVETGTTHEMHLRNKVLRSMDMLTRFKESITNGRVYDYVKEDAQNAK